MLQKYGSKTALTRRSFNELSQPFQKGFEQSHAALCSGSPGSRRIILLMRRRPAAPRVSTNGTAGRGSSGLGRSIFWFAADSPPFFLPPSRRDAPMMTSAKAKTDFRAAAVAAEVVVRRRPRLAGPRCSKSDKSASGPQPEKVKQTTYNQASFILARYLGALFLCPRLSSTFW